MSRGRRRKPDAQPGRVQADRYRRRTAGFAGAERRSGGRVRPAGGRCGNPSERTPDGARLACPRAGRARSRGDGDDATDGGVRAVLRERLERLAGARRRPTPSRRLFHTRSHGPRDGPGTTQRVDRVRRQSSSRVDRHGRPPGRRRRDPGASDRRPRRSRDERDGAGHDRLTRGARPPTPGGSPSRYPPGAAGDDL